jgi:hypothetical protein
MTDTLTPEENRDLIKAFISTALKIENPSPILILAKGKGRIANMIIGDRMELIGMMECFKHQIIELDFGPPEILEEVRSDEDGPRKED